MQRHWPEESDQSQRVAGTATTTTTTTTTTTLRSHFGSSRGYPQRFSAAWGTVRCHLEQAKEVHSAFAESLCYSEQRLILVCCSQFDVGPWAILWLDLSYAVGSVRAADTSILLEVQSGLMKGDYSVIDYSMQCGSFDVWVSLPAACSSAASPRCACACRRRVSVSFAWSCPLR